MYYPKPTAPSHEALLQKIAETVNLVPSVTGLSPVKRFEDIPLAIRDLQACYRDAALARNGGQSYTQIAKRVVELEAEVERATTAMEHHQGLEASYKEAWKAAERDRDAALKALEKIYDLSNLSQVDEEEIWKTAARALGRPV
jgi:hypothetical protein